MMFRLLLISIDGLLTGMTIIHSIYHSVIPVIPSNKILSNNPSKLKLVCTFTNISSTLDLKFTIGSGGCDIDNKKCGIKIHNNKNLNSPTSNEKYGP